MTQRFLRGAILIAALGVQVQQAWPCSWAVGYFHQVTALRGTVVGTSRGWPRWVRQHVLRDGVNLRLYEYRWPLHDRADMKLVKMVQTDSKGRFDFGALQQGHYTLVIDWPEEYANWFDVEIASLARPTAFVKIDVTAVYPDCTGGHEFVTFSQ